MSQPTGAVPARRRARLVLARVDPWSAMKVGFVLSIAVAIIIVVAISLLWLLFSLAGVFDTVGRTINEIVGSSVDARSWLSFARVIGATMLVAAVEIVLTTALVTLGAALYNLAAGFVGGLEVVLSDEA